MATNRDLLKEAIADAKAVKETAIANAKAALEEAFTPQLKSMFAAKLQEMEKDEDLEEMYGMSEDEKDLEERLGTGFDPDGEPGFDGPRGNFGKIDEEDKEDMNEIDLEELLRELEEEGKMEDLNEAEADDDDDVDGDESDDDDEEGTPLDLEDMTDEDLKKIIEDVISDMIKSGELEAGHEGMGDEEGVEVKDEEEVDLAELLKEIEEMEDKMYEEKEPIDEMDLTGYHWIWTALPWILSSGVVFGFFINYLKNKDIIAAKEAEEWKRTFSKTPKQTARELGKELQDKGANAKDIATAALTSAEKAPVKEESSELQEAYKTIKALKSELNEINLLNAKLLYTNKIFKAKNLNESQKVKVLSSFDKATTVGEVKLVFETLNEGIKVKSNVIKENLGRASKTTVTPNVKKPIVESNDAFLRMQKLAGII
jgi:hypothetical protein